METKIREIQPMAAEAWVRHDPGLQDSQLIMPVGKNEPGSRTEVKADDKSPQGGAPRLGPEKSKELVEEVQRYLEEFNIELNFKVHDKTGEVIVQVFNRDTGKMIRQIPPDDLVRLHEKLEELRGVLFNGKV